MGQLCYLSDEQAGIPDRLKPGKKRAEWRFRVRGIESAQGQGMPQRGEVQQVDEAQIYTRLAGIFEDVFDDESIQVTPGLTAKDVDGWDSLTHIRLILTVEKAFGIKFSTSEIGKLENVGDLVKLIEQRA